MLQFARDGVVNIAGLDISSDVLEETERLVKEQFPAVSFLSLVGDLTQADKIEFAINTVVEKFGRLDYAVNNAGIGQPLGVTGETAPEDFDKVIGVNMKGLWNCERFELGHMMKQSPLTLNPSV